jgi:hypothetical protein
MKMAVAAGKTSLGALDLFVPFALLVPVSGGGDVPDLLYTFSDTNPPPLANLFPRLNAGWIYRFMLSSNAYKGLPPITVRQNSRIGLTITHRVHEYTPRGKPTSREPRFTLQFEREHSCSSRRSILRTNLASFRSSSIHE